MHTLFATILIALVVVSEGAKCPKEYSLCEQGADFDVAKYQGLWYTQLQSTSFYFGRNCFCETANYTLTSASTVGVNNLCRKGSLSAPLTGAQGQATIANASNPCDLRVLFPGAPVAGPYQIIASDYTTYSVVASCLGAVGRTLDDDDVWVLTRALTVPQSLLDSITSKLTAMGFDLDDVKPVPTVGCPPV